MHFLMPLIGATLGPRDVENRVIGLGGKGRVVGDIWCSLNRLTRFTGCQGSTPDCRSGFFLIPWGYVGWEGEQARRTGPCACNEARVIKASNLIATSHHALATQRPLRARMHARTDTHTEQALRRDAAPSTLHLPQQILSPVAYSRHEWESGGGAAVALLAHTLTQMFKGVAALWEFPPPTLSLSFSQSCFFTPNTTLGTQRSRMSCGKLTSRLPFSFLIVPHPVTFGP